MSYHQPPENLTNTVVGIPAPALAPFPDPVIIPIPELIDSPVAETWSKWDLALYVGAPIALGLAGLWFYKRRRNAKAKDDKTGTDSIGVTEALPKSKVSKPDEPQGRQELAQAAKTRGNRFFKDGRYEEAITCYTEAIKTCPPGIKADISTFYQNRAAAYESLKNYPKVVEDCNAALEMNSKYSKALARRSKAYEVLEKYRESLEDITKACLLEGFQNQTYLLAADRVLKTLGKSRAAADYKNKKAIHPSKFFVENYLAGFVNDPVKLKFISKDANDLARMGIKVKDHQGGGEEPEPVEEEDKIGDNGAVLLEKPSPFERAKNCLSTQDYDDIIPLCNEELEPLDGKEQSLHRAEALLLRGTMKLLQGLGYEAELDFAEIGHMEAISNRVKSMALVREACLMMQRQSGEKALSKFIQAKRIDPDNSDLYHHHGQQLLQMERVDEAITQFEKSIELSPDFPTSHVQKYYAMHRKAIGREDLNLLHRAQDGFEETIKKFPTCSDALILYAQALSDQTKFEEADKHFQKAHKVQPQNANNIVHRGLMLLQWKGDVDKTLELIEEALAIDPSCQYAYEIRGTIEVQRGHLPQAMECFHKAIALSTSEAEMSHLYSLKEAAEIQVQVAKDLNLQLPTGMV